MSRSQYKPFIYNSYYKFPFNLRKNKDVSFYKNLEVTLLARTRLSKKQRLLLKDIKFKICPRNITVVEEMIGLYSKIHKGNGWVNIKFTKEMLNIKAGSLSPTRAISPIKLNEKNIHEVGNPIKGKKHLAMKQLTKVKIKKQKKRRKK